MDTTDEAAGDSGSGASEVPAAKPAKMATKKAPAKKAPAKKSSKKAPAKKAAAKKSNQGAEGSAYPRHNVEAALRIPKAIHDQNGGNPATRKEAAEFLGSPNVSGAFNLEVASAVKYGFLETDAGTLTVTPRAKQAFAPESETDRIQAIRDAVLAAPDLSTVYNYYRGESLPDETFFDNALANRFKVPADKIAEFKDIFRSSMRSAALLDESGDRPKLLDVGRDDAHKAQLGNPPAAPGAPKAKVAAGESCFVMQPFSAPLGTYYESIFKPAIEQAGLTAVRADDDIFATGKIIDQIWRGINDARVLVAELTSKNPNVFYELGLAHALEKPVVLVSSNEDDVPFDLRHIRVIVYDVTDPFWGTKLIDKVADNIRAALSTPEEAVFRLAPPP